MNYKELKRYIPSFLFFGFICYLILLRDMNKENLIIIIGHKVPFGDKIGHFFLFGILAYLLNIAARLYKVNLGRLSLYFAPLVVLGFAIFEELTQIAFPSRSFDWNDMLFDVLGIAFFSFLSRLSYRRLKEAA